MKTGVTVYLIFILLPVLRGQNNPCADCPCLRDRAEQLERARKYGEAISMYQAYSVCEPTQQAVVSKRIIAIQDKTLREKKAADEARERAKKSETEAKFQAAKAQSSEVEAAKQAANAKYQAQLARAETQKAQKRARANQNLATTLDVLRQNPTMALRMSEAILQNQPDDAGAQQLFNDIVSNKDHYFYKRQLFDGHVKTVGEVVISPDGSMIMSSGRDSTVCLWKSDGQLLKKFENLPGHLVMPRFSQTGHYVLLAGLTWVLIGDIDTAQACAATTINLPPAKYAAAALSPDGTKWIYGDKTGVLWLGDSQGALIDSITTTGQPIEKIAFSADGRRIIASGQDSTAFIWMLDQSPKQLNFLNGHATAITEALFSQFGELALTVSDDNMIRIWTPAGKLVNTIRENEKINQITFLKPDTLFIQTEDRLLLRNINGNSPIAFNQEPNQVYMGYVCSRDAGQNNRQRLIFVSKAKNNLENPAMLRVFNTAGRYQLRFAIPNSDKFPVAADVTADNEIRLFYRLKQGFECLQFNNRQPRQVPYPVKGSRLLAGAPDRPAVLQFTPDNYLLLSTPGDSAVRLYDPIKKEFRPYVLQKNNCITNNVLINPIFSASNNRFYYLTLNADFTATLWSKERSDALGRIEIPDQGLSSGLYLATFSPDGRSILTVHQDSTLWLWNLHEAKRQMIGKHPGQLSCIGFSPDGLLIATAGDDGFLRLWSVAERREIDNLSIPGAQTLMFNFLPDPAQHRLLVKAKGKNHNEISLWDYSALNKPLTSWRGYWKDLQHNVWERESWEYAVLSPDGRHLLLSGAQGEQPTLADTDGPEMIELNGRYGHAQAAMFSPDGQYLLTGGDDDAAHLWQLNGHEIAVFPEHSRGVTQVAISPNGYMAATLDGTGTARIWELPAVLLDKKVEKFTINDLAAFDFIPEPEQKNAIDDPRALYHAAFNYFNQRDTVTAHELFDRLLHSKATNQGEEVWYYWYVLGKSIGQDHWAELLKQKQSLFHPLAERFKRSGHYWEAKQLYELLLSENTPDPFLMGDYLETCELGGFLLDQSQFLKEEKNADKLLLFAKYFQSVRDTASALQLYQESLNQKFNVEALIRLLECTAEPLAFSRVLQNNMPKVTRLNDIVQLAHFLRSQKHTTEAIALYEASLKKKELPEVVIALYEISLQTPPNTFDTTRFFQTNSPEALRRYADYFDEHNQYQLKSDLLERMIKLDEADAFDYYELYLAQKALGHDIMPRLIGLDSSRIVYRLMVIFADNGQNLNARYRAKKVENYTNATRLGERLLQLAPQNSGYLQQVTRFYNSLGWHRLFTGDFRGSEAAVRRGMELDSSYAYLYTNLPPALLFQGKVNEAKTLYTRYESRPLSTLNDLPFVRDGYLSDFDDFRLDHTTNPQTPFTAKMMQDMTEIENVLKGLPPNGNTNK